MFLALNAYNTFTDEEKEIEKLFGKLRKANFIAQISQIDPFLLQLMLISVL